mmetsp:Transcript_17669/g.26312  ORF Transcript_17669/g.26312 Transcript_17669/m.26312 type:complete len:229 (-) Transcript_17669:86-772(-)
MSSALILSSGMAISKAWYSVPQIFRFGISGTLGNVILFFMDSSFYKNVMLKYAKDFPKLVNQNAESVSFFVSYFFQIVVQHVMNAFLVFGWHTIDTRKKYMVSLAGCYATLGSSLVLSTFLNAFMLKNGVPKNIAFWGTMYGFGVINFLVLSRLSPPKEKVETDSLHLSEVPRGGEVLLPTTMATPSVYRAKRDDHLSDMLNFHARIPHKRRDELIEFIKSTGNKMMV